MSSHESDIAADSLQLLELTLTIGRTLHLEFEQRCQEFLRILLARKNLSYGAVWARRSALYRDANDTEAELICALPRVRADTVTLPTHHPSFSVLREQRVHIIRDSNPDFSSHVLEANIDAGSFCYLKLGDIGVLRLYSTKPDSFSVRETNQLLDIIEMFTISIEGALAQRRLRQEVEERHVVEGQLRQVQKLEAVGRLAGGIAHEFNNLLMVISGSIELAKTRLHADDELTDILDAAMTATHRGAELTDRMLSYGRKQILLSKLVDLNEVVTQSVALTRPLLGEHINIVTALSERICLSKLDQGQMESALLNLAVNARDAMPSGGTLTIATAHVHLGEKFAREHQVDVGDYIVVSVTDTGTGMSPEVIEHVFEPFFTTKEVGKGSGLGLSMVHGFARQTGGYAEIESVEGQKTTVKLYFPRAVKEGHSNNVTVTAEQAAEDAEGVKILVVEDDALVRGVILQALNDQGYAAIAAENGASALATFKKHPEIEFVVTDVVMPGDMDGIQLANRIHEQCSTTKIVLISGYTELDVESRGLSSSGLHLLRKPFEVRDLIQLLQKL